MCGPAPPGAHWDQQPSSEKTGETPQQETEPTTPQQTEHSRYVEKIWTNIMDYIMTILRERAVTGLVIDHAIEGDAGGT